MATKTAKKTDIINGRISLLFLGLLLFAGLLWLERSARYRYDLIFRPMLIWLLPVCFGLAAIAFVVLLILRKKKGKDENKRIFSVSFLMIPAVALMAAFLFPWLTLFSNGLQFFRLATELVFYAALGGYAGYIGCHKISPAAVPLAGALTINCLALYYFYDRHLSPTTFILNTAEFHYLDGWVVALILIGVVAVGALLALLIGRNRKKIFSPWSILIPGILTVLLLAINVLFDLSILPVRIMFFGGIGLTAAWYITWCILKKRKKN